jgi:hypothetical protein
MCRLPDVAGLIYSRLHSVSGGRPLQPQSANETCPGDKRPVYMEVKFIVNMTIKATEFMYGNYFI